MDNKSLVCDMEIVYEGYSWCDLSDNPCFKETGECDYYKDLVKELDGDEE